MLALGRPGAAKKSRATTIGEDAGYFQAVPSFGEASQEQAGTARLRKKGVSPFPSLSEALQEQAGTACLRYPSLRDV